MYLKFIPIVFLLLILHGVVHATNPRGMGIGLRYGYTEDQTVFFPGDDTDKKYISFDQQHSNVNKNRPQRFPIIFQSDEDLISSWIFGLWYFDFNTLNKENLPPGLKSTTYQELLDENDNSGFSVRSSDTYISEFQSKFPEYNSIISSAAEPSLSADYNINQIAVGKSYGIFLPIGNNHRILTFGLGFGLNYSQGMHKINVCDPFTVASEDKDGIVSFKSPIIYFGPYREGICNNKTELYSESISNFGFSVNALIKTYSYIGESIEVNFLEGDFFSNPYAGTFSGALKPYYAHNYTNILSTVYRF